MVELNEKNKELAILMTFKYNGTRPEFIPEKVIEGQYSNDNFIFISQDTGNLYYHINEILIFENISDYDGIKFYAFRKNINDLTQKFPTLNIEKIKEILLLEALEYIYNLDIIKYNSKNKILDITKTKKSDGTITLFEDSDSKKIKELQEDLRFSNQILKEVIENENYNETDEYYNDPKNETEEDYNNFFITDEQNYLFNPHELSKKIKQHVYGQNDAIDKIVQAIWSNYFEMNDEEFNKENILVLGTSGVGKTEIFRRIQKELSNTIVHIADLSSITQTGYVGNSLDDIIKGLVMKCIEVKNGIEYINKSKLEHSIIVLDEFDKISIKNQTGTDVGNRPVQDELLKIIEGKEMQISIPLNGYLMPLPITIDTSKITFACCGAFEGINKANNKTMGFGNDISKNNSLKTYHEVTDEDIRQYGFINELVARLPVIVALDDLSLEILIKIIKNPSKSLFTKKLKILRSLVQSVEIKEALYEELAKQALNKKMGARGIDKVSADLFTPIITTVSNTEVVYEYAQLNEETVHNPKKYVLKPKGNN